MGLSLAGTLAARTAAANEAVAVPAVDSTSDWAAVRAQFNLAPDWLHFSQFYIVSHPKPVRDAIERFRNMLDTHPFTTVEHGMGFESFLGEEAQQDPFPVRVQQAAASYIDGKPEEAGRRGARHHARPLRASRGDSPRGREGGRHLAARTALRRSDPGLGR